MRQHGRSLLQELLLDVLVWNVGSKLLHNRPCGGKGLFGLLLSLLALIKLAQGNANAPEPWSQTLRMRSFLRGSQHIFGFLYPAKCGQSLPAQLPEARDDMRAR